jgi:Holliday junction resolvase RusA-like endonuclease
MNYAFTIPLAPRTKKNSGQITKNGAFIPSKAYLQYHKDCKYFVKRLDHPIDYPVNVKALYYKDTHRKSDLINYHSALHDILVDYGVLADDNDEIVVSTDGSRVYYGGKEARTEIWITESEVSP